MHRNFLSAIGRGLSCILPRAAAPKILAGLGGLLLAANGFATPVVVTPTDLQGWLLADGKSGTSPAQITGNRPDDGNGSIQLKTAKKFQSIFNQTLGMKCSLEELFEVSELK